MSPLHRMHYFRKTLHRLNDISFFELTILKHEDNHSLWGKKIVKQLQMMLISHAPLKLKTLNQVLNMGSAVVLQGGHEIFG